MWLSIRTTSGSDERTPSERHERAVGQIDRELVAGGEARDAADMIVVLVGHDDRVEILRNEPAPAQPIDRVLDAETAVEQDAGGTRLDDETVALAAAAQ